MTETIFKEEIEQLYAIAADKIAESIAELLESKDSVVLAIPGGRSVPGIFSELKKRKVDWEKVHIFMVDERLVPLDHQDSNFRLAKTALLNQLTSEGKLPKENIHPFKFNDHVEDAGTSDYADELMMYGGKYNIILLSAGEDGHIGALYPDHYSMSSGEDFFVVMHDSPKPPKDRMSISRKLISKTSTAIILFVGEKKKDAFRNFMDQTRTPEKCPAKLVSSAGKVYAITNIKL